MKVLHFGRFDAPDFGGLERHVGLLLRGLARDIEVENLVANTRWALEAEEKDGVRVLRVPSLGTAASVALAPTLAWHARQRWREARFDIAHLHFPDPLSQIAAQSLPASARIVVTWHSDIVRQRQLLALYRPFLERFLRRIDAIVAATPRHFETSTQLGALPAKTPRRVIPYGIDLARFSPAAKRNPVPRIFAVGRHVYYKGFEYLIRAMREVDAKLVLGGTGPLLEQHKALARELGVQDKVEFPGRIPDEALPACYSSADVFCMPSVERSEAFGIVQVEAMASGVPVVCCRLGNGVNHVHVDGVTGLAVPPRDPPALAAALRTLLADAGLRQKMGEAGRARALAEYSAEKMVAAHLELYRELLRSSR